jgi:putative flippase GtrA
VFRTIDWLLEIGRVARFGIVGVFATIVYVCASFLAIDVLALSPVVGSIVGQAASAAVSYFGHAMYSFRVEIDHKTFRSGLAPLSRREAPDKSQYHSRNA